jgi:hypothetical protein
MHPKGSMYGGKFMMGRGSDGAMGRIKNHDAVMLYLNLLECYFIFVSFFSFPFSFPKKIVLFSRKSQLI